MERIGDRTVPCGEPVETDREDEIAGTAISDQHDIFSFVDMGHLT